MSDLKGNDSFITRLERNLQEDRAIATGLCSVSSRDLKDIVFHFRRLDNDARNDYHTYQKENEALRKENDALVEALERVKEDLSNCEPPSSNDLDDLLNVIEAALKAARG